MGSILLGSCFQGCGWQCDFHFGHGLDTIEESAINEKCCIQVLRILTDKADAEIMELEDDLAIIQSQLRWAQHGTHEEVEEWCATFRDLIDSLGASIHSIRNENVLGEKSVTADSIMHREPATRIYDIITTLLQQNFPKDHEQVGDLSNSKKCTIDSCESNTVFKVTEQSLPARAPNSDPSSSGGQMTVSEVENKLEIAVKEEYDLTDTTSVTTCCDGEKPEVRMNEKVEFNGNNAISDCGNQSCLSSMDSVEEKHGAVNDTKGSNGSERHGSASSQRAEKRKAIEPTTVAICQRNPFGRASNTSSVLEVVVKQDGPHSPDTSNSGSDTNYELPIANFMLSRHKPKPKKKPKLNVSGIKPPTTSSPKIQYSCQEVKLQLQSRGISRGILDPCPSEAKRQRLCGLTMDSTSMKQVLDVGCNLDPIPKIAKGMRSKVVEVAERRTGLYSVDDQEDASNCTTGKKLSIMKPSCEDTRADAIIGLFGCKDSHLCRSESPCLEDMKMSELRVLARKHDVVGYSKLKKSELVELLSKKVGYS